MLHTHTHTHTQVHAHIILSEFASLCTHLTVHMLHKTHLGFSNVWIFFFCNSSNGNQRSDDVKASKSYLTMPDSRLFLNYSAVIWFGPIYNIQWVTSSCYLIGYSHLTPCAEWKSKTLNTVI